MIAFFFFSRGLTAPHPHLIKAHIIEPSEGWEEGKRGGGRKLCWWPEKEQLMAEEGVGEFLPQGLRLFSWAVWYLGYRLDKGD